MPLKTILNAILGWGRHLTPNQKLVTFLLASNIFTNWVSYQDRSGQKKLDKERYTQMQNDLNGKLFRCEASNEKLLNHIIDDTHRKQALEDSLKILNP